MGASSRRLLCCFLLWEALSADPVSRASTNWALTVDTPILDAERNVFALRGKEGDEKKSEARRRQLPYFVRLYDDVPMLRRLTGYRPDQLPMWRVDFEENGRPVLFQEYAEGRAVRRVELDGEGQVLAEWRMENGAQVSSRWTYARLEMGPGRVPAKSFPVFVSYAVDGKPLESRRFSWQEGMRIKEERLDGNGGLVEVLHRSVAATAKGREVTEIRVRPDGREMERRVLTEDGKGRLLFAKTGAFTEEYQWDSGQNLSRQLLRENLHGRLAVASAWTWSEREIPPPLFSMAAGKTPLSLHTSWKIDALPGLKDRLLLSRRDGSEVEERLSALGTPEGSGLRLRVRAGGLDQARLDFDRQGRLLRKVLIDESGRIRGRYEFAWEGKTGRLSSMAWGDGTGPVSRTVHLRYQGNITPPAGKSDPLSPPDLFFTWGQALFDLARGQLGAPSGNLELQVQDLLECMRFMETTGVESATELDGLGAPRRFVRFSVERLKYATRWAYEIHERRVDDPQRQAEWPTSVEKKRGVRVQDRDQLEAEQTASFGRFVSATNLGGAGWKERSRDFHLQTIEFWTDPKGATLTAGRIVRHGAEAEESPARVLSGGREANQEAPGILERILREYHDALSKLQPKLSAKSGDGVPAHAK